MVAPAKSRSNNNKIARLTATKYMQTTTSTWDKTIDSLRAIRGPPSLALTKQVFYGQDGHAVVANKGSHLFHADDGRHTIYWEGPPNHRHVYALPKMRSLPRFNVTIGSANGILLFDDDEASLSGAFLWISVTRGRGMELEVEVGDQRRKTVNVLPGSVSVKVGGHNKSAVYDLILDERSAWPFKIRTKIDLAKMLNGTLGDLRGFDGLSVRRNHCSYRRVEVSDGRVSSAQDLLDAGIGCLDFGSASQVEMLRTGNDLLILSSLGSRLLILEYYNYASTTGRVDLRLAVSLSGGKVQLSPAEFNLRTANPLKHKIYSTEDWETITVYHNRPVDRNLVGVLDCRGFSVANVTLTVPHSSRAVEERSDLSMSLDNGSAQKSVVLKNWSLDGRARRIVLVLDDATITRRVCPAILIG